MESNNINDKINIENINKVSNYNSEISINIAFAEKSSNKEFHHERFPSKIGGYPTMLFPIDSITNNLYGNIKFNKKEDEINFNFNCDFCNNKLTFLLQLYSIIESNPEAYHRSLYLFFCINCFNSKHSFKCLRLQLPEKSEFYNSCKAKDIKKLTSYIPNLNNKIILNPEYNLCIEDESKRGLEIYSKLNNELNEGSTKDDFEEEDFISNPYDAYLTKADNEIINKLIKNYKEVEDGNIEEENVNNYNNNTNNNNYKNTKLEDDAEDELLSKMAERSMFKPEDDIFYKFFSAIVNENPQQIIRYCRDNIKPLWYCKSNMMTNKNITCKYCGKKKIFEFQVMPYVFLLYKELINNNIGTIVIYTCDCSVKVSEEYVYVQRTGEKVFDIKSKKFINNDITLENSVLVKDNNNNSNKIEGFGTSNQVEDEDGFIAVKKVKKNKHTNDVNTTNKKNKNLDKNNPFTNNNWKD